MLPTVIIASALMAHVGEVDDVRGDTSLHRAIHNPQSNFERKIFRASDQDLATQNNSGSTPLMSAVIWNNRKAVTLLLARDVQQINTVDKHDRTPLHYAAGLGLSDITRILLENGALLDIKDENLQTPLDIVLRRHGKDHKFTQLLERWSIDQQEPNRAVLCEPNEESVE